MIVRYWHMLCSSSTIRIFSPDMPNLLHHRIPNLAARTGARPSGRRLRVHPGLARGAAGGHAAGHLGQVDAELCSPFGTSVGVDATAMAFDDLGGNRQPQPRTLRFRGMERLEDRRLHARVDPGTGVL